MDGFMCKTRSPASVLPQERGPWRAQLEDSANQTLPLVQGWGGAGEVELTVT